MFSLLLGIILSANETATSSATSKTGVPSTTNIFLTCCISIFVIAACVSILCIKPTNDNEAFGSQTAILEQTII